MKHVFGARPSGRFSGLSSPPFRFAPSLLLLSLQLLLCLWASAAASNPDATTSSSESRSLLEKWLNAQTNITTWSADFIQTRSLKSLTRPLTSSGHLWFAAPNRFRWELGKPAQTIAVRAPDEMLIFYPRLKRVEKFPLNGNALGPWRDTLALLEAGFPRSQAQLQAQYDIVSFEATPDRCKLAMRPKSAAARKMMPLIQLEFSPDTLSLTATELEFADGSRMRNDFSNPQLNPTLDAAMFNPPIPADFKVQEPLAGKR